MKRGENLNLMPEMSGAKFPHPNRGGIAMHPEIIQMTMTGTQVVWKPTTLT